MDPIVIIAAGKGTRMASMGDSKPLVPLLGRPLILRVMETAREAGASRFVIVTGYKAEIIERVLETFAREQGLSVTFVYNPEYDEPNGISVFKAHEAVEENFFLLMSDHMFDVGILRQLGETSMEHHDVRLAVDTRLENNPLVDLDDVTKVLVENGNIRDIGKTIPRYNAFDTGIFRCTPRLFPALEAGINNGESSLSGGICQLAGRGRAGVMDIGSADWIDVDNEEMLKKAEIMIRNRG